MSGLEVLAILGLIGTCWEPLKDVLGSIKDIYDQAKGLMEEYEGVTMQFCNLQTVLATLQVVLERVEQRSKTEPLAQASRASLNQILGNCKSSIEELKDLFEKHYLPGQCQTPAKLKRALHILAGEPQLANIQNQIDRYINAITAHSSAFAPTVQEISSVVTVDLEKIIDRRCERLESLLKKQRRRVSAPDLGSGSTESTSFPQRTPSDRIPTRPDPSELHSQRLVCTSTEDIVSSILFSPTASSVFSDEDAEAASPISEIEDSLGLPTPSNSRHEKNVLALDKANDLIAQGSEHIPKPSVSPLDISRANTKARRAFLDAVSALDLVSEQELHMALRKYRGLTHASLCLTRVTKAEERDDHLANAHMYNSEARAAADRYFGALETNPTAARIAQSQVTLDQASVRVRQARIAAKTSTVKRQSAAADPASAVGMAMDAFRIYKEVASDYEGACWTGMDYDIHAQALLGCGEVVQMLQLVYGSLVVAGLGCKEPQHYFDCAIRSATSGNRVPGTPTDAKDSIRRSFGRILCMQATGLGKGQVVEADADSHSA